jgi:quercetin dioxygenase-like cupin family protein
MKVCSFTSVAANDVEMEGAHRVRMRLLIGECDGAPNFVMRQFEVAPGGYTPKHEHNYEHQVFVLDGTGVVLDGEKERPLKAGDCVFVAANELHQFRNTGYQPLRFLCLIPRLDKCSL